MAGLEALHGLRALAGERVDLTLIAPENEFVYRPLAVKEPFDVGRVRQVPLTRAARQAGADFFGATVTAVDLEDKVARTSDGSALEYDALVMAVGATALQAIPNAITWDDRADSVGGLVRDIDEVTAIAWWSSFPRARLGRCGDTSSRCSSRARPTACLPITAPR